MPRPYLVCVYKAIEIEKKDGFFVLLGGDVLKTLGCVFVYLFRKAFAYA